MRTVKSPTGSLRAERAEVTRRRILTAARALFSSRGYGATTLREIAEEAGVAVQTVYAVFASKAAILRVLREEVRDDPAADAAFSTALEARSIGEAFDAFARSIRLRWEAGHDVVTANLDAATSDPALRPEVDAVLDVRRRGIKRLAAALVERGAGHEAAWIAAVLDALSMPEAYDELTGVHGWTPDAYETWLRATLRATIAGTPGRAGGRRTTSRAAADRGPQAPAATSER